MNNNIAVESNLGAVKDFLSGKGYNVDIIENDGPASNPEKYDAFVVTGLNSNVLGMHDTKTKAVVIKAEGLTPEDVYNQLKSRLS